MKTDSKTTFYIVRHGQAVGNEKRIIMGHKDLPLTKLGKTQARKLGKQFENITFDFVFSSDLMRAKQTAEIITLQKKLAIQTTYLLREKSLGIYEGKSYEAFDTYDELIKNLSLSEQYTFEGHGVESNEAITARVILFLRETAILYPGNTILVTSHAGVMRSILIHLGYGTYDTFFTHHISNTAYIVVESDGVEFELKSTQGVEPPDGVS